MDISDLQATVTAGSCSSRLILNVPKARSQGVELSFAKTLGTSFDVDLSASYTDSELSSTLRDTSGNVLAGIESGNRLPTVPELQGVAAGTYRWNAGGWLGTFTGVYQHVGSRFTQIGDQAAGFGVVVLDGFAGDIGGPYTQPTHTFDAELPAYDIVNLRLGFANEKWDLAAYVNNVTDEVALLSLDQERGTRARQGYLINQSRTFGITARVKLY
jgi:iron complex outermembrane receptor protein